MADNARNTDWGAELPFGLQRCFDFSVIRTIDDVKKLFSALPNRDRGRAALRIYKHRGLLGKDVAYAALVTAWQHDHEYVRAAFRNDMCFANALRRVSPASKRKRAVRVWRGVNRIEGALGASWTTNRDQACWFAMRFFERHQTAFLFTCLLPPNQIVTEYDGRSEREVIPHLGELAERVFLDEGNGKIRMKLSDGFSHSDVHPAAIANWRKGYARVAATREAEKKATVAFFRSSTPPSCGETARVSEGCAWGAIAPPHTDSLES